MRSEIIATVIGVLLSYPILAGTVPAGNHRAAPAPDCEAGVVCSGSLVAAGRGALFYNRVPTGIVKLDAQTGQPLWTFSPPKGWVASNLVTTRSLLFFAGNTAGPCGPIYAVDTESGQTKWSKDYSSCRLWSDGQRLYIQGATGDGVRALDPMTGQQLWLAEDETPQFVLNLVVRNGRVYTNDRVLDAETGKTLFWWPKEAAISSLLAGDSLVYAAGRSGVVTAYGATAQQKEWQSKLLAGERIVIFATASELVYAVGYAGNSMKARDGILQAFHANSGEPKWQYRIQSCCQDLDASPVGVGGSVLFLLKPLDAESGTELVALDAATGKLLWSFQSTVTLQGPPFPRRPNVYVVDAQGTLVALEASTGRRVWAYKPFSNGDYGGGP